MDMGDGVEVKHKRWGVYGADKQDNGTLTPGGENKWLYLVSASYLLLQFPGLIGRGRRECYSNKGLSELALYDLRTKECPRWVRLAWQCFESMWCYI